MTGWTCFVNNNKKIKIIFHKRDQSTTKAGENIMFRLDDISLSKLQNYRAYSTQANAIYFMKVVFRQLSSAYHHRRPQMVKHNGLTLPSMSGFILQIIV